MGYVGTWAVGGSQRNSVMEIEIYDEQLRIWEWCEDSRDYVVTVFDLDEEGLDAAKVFILDHIDVMVQP